MSSDLSVLIPVHNGANLVSRAIESVLAQTHKPAEILVLDDGSTDATADVASRYPVTVLRQANQGIGRTRQRLVEQAKSGWVAFLDHDDYWEPKKLELQEPYTWDERIGIVHTGYGFFFTDGDRRMIEPIHAETLDHVLPDCLINTCSTVVRKQAILEAGGFADSSVAEDWLMWLLIASRYEIVQVPEILTWTLKRPGSASSPSSQWYEGERKVIAEILRGFEQRYCRFPAEAVAEKKRQLVRKLAVIDSLEAEALDREGQRHQAREFHLRAIKHAPAMKGAWLRMAKHLTHL